MIKRFWYAPPLLIIAVFIFTRHYGKTGLFFSAVKDIRFTEVKRRFNNGLVFDKQGYQLEPSWKLYFTADDSVNVYSPKMKRFYGFHVYFDHDSVFNMVDAWFKLKHLGKDSIVLQALRVENKVIKDDDEGSKVYLTFYPDNKIKNTSIPGLPTRNDTAYIQSRAKLANSKMDSAFSARYPVVLTSKSPLVKVEKVVSVSTPLSKIDPSVDYLYPEYNITINKAYEDFDYSFSVFVDDRGLMHFRKSTIPYPSAFQKTYTDVMKGIIDGYLKLYLDVTPGKTLGIAHTSVILLNVTGKRAINQ